MSTGRKEGLTVNQLIEMIKADAIEWAAESMKGRLKASLEVTDFGFRVSVESDAGAVASCTYRSNGMRSMYELTKGENKR